MCRLRNKGWLIEVLKRSINHESWLIGFRGFVRIPSIWIYGYMGIWIYGYMDVGYVDVYKPWLGLTGGGRASALSPPDPPSPDNL